MPAGGHRREKSYSSSMTWNICHAAEDAHLVRPLRRFLEISGLDCSCHVKPPAGDAEGTIVICGESFTDQSWLGRILEDQPDAIAVLIAPVNPGSQRRTIIDLRSWPSRSADKTLLSMVEWLKQGRPGSFAHATADPQTAPRSRWSNENSLIVLLMLLVVTGLGVLLSIDHQPATPGAGPVAANETARPPRSSQVSPDRPKEIADSAQRNRIARCHTTDGLQPSCSAILSGKSPGGTRTQVAANLSTTSGGVNAVANADVADPATPAPACSGYFSFGCATLECDKNADAESRHLVGR